VVLNVVYLAGGVAAFLGFFRIARTRGQLLSVGE
jgi:ABC-2 type transport system permease protein